MCETERFKSKHAPERDCVIASEHRLSHVSIRQLLRRVYPGAVRLERPQILQYTLVNIPSSLNTSVVNLVPR